MAAVRVVSRLILSGLLCLTTACSNKSTTCCANGRDSGDRSAIDASGGEANDSESLQRLDGGPLPEAREAAPARLPDAHTRDAGLGRGRSSGCNKRQTGSGRYDAFGTQASGLDRVYYFYVPTDYDATRAYPVVFRFHGYGGSGRSGGLEIEQASDAGALVISPNGLLAANGKDLSWNPANEAADLTYFDRLLEWVATRYCVDLDQIYAYGFSAGGGMAQLLACRRGEAVRAVGTIAAIDRTANETCQGMTAGYLTYDQNDPAVPLADGVAVRDHLLLQNQCTSDSETIGTSCVRYSHCAAGEPVVWCVTNTPAATAHDPGGAAVARPIWQFFSSLPPTE